MGQFLSICQKKPNKRDIEVQQGQNRLEQPTRIEKPVGVQKPPRVVKESGRKLAESPNVSSDADLSPAQAARLAAEKRSEINKEKSKTRLRKHTFY
ncbi:hypothetical protein SPOG_03701 [Schizosaccharomyces cryophilus OY26]|uniref:Uncharacterized protein n=1 Tax=Schizosaccharomyces cryophilus (strain OY26 / ATCC MYA-4695 / CBS 11777 / NBRC 106824 / NRRL Y48691) TaxID=653667 RepID=S9VZQ8_SCHCR|nr:uncharacterized protein SPOG_03701 [Schizosaccharomyces cryophilus OY26]EPY53163.1 hypothetical protein SPOG_03701 [Schizosaccharomyces cryophilus OY26]